VHLGVGGNFNTVVKRATRIMNKVYYSDHIMWPIGIWEGRENEETVRNTVIKMTQERKTKIYKEKDGYELERGDLVLLDIGNIKINRMKLEFITKRPFLIPAKLFSTTYKLDFGS
jgi:hypothetical protein